MMRGRVGTCVALALGAALWLGPAVAERRVLLAFDASGHRVHRVSDGGAERRLLSSRAAKAVAVDPAIAAASGNAVLVWLDAEGRTLAIGRAPDPRVGHAPTVGAHGRPVALEEGAWRARGPSAARVLELRLPRRDDPPLAAELWRLPLDETDVPKRR